MDMGHRKPVHNFLWAEKSTHKHRYYFCYTISNEWNSTLNSRTIFHQKQTGKNNIYLFYLIVSQVMKSYLECIESSEGSFESGYSLC